MTEIEVKVPATSPASYRIIISQGSLTQAIDRTQKLLPGKSIFIVTDANVAASGHLQRLLGSRRMPCFVVEPAGEISKNMATVTKVVEAMEAASLGRDTVVVALGGGTVGDMAGFAASIFKRGVPVVHIPTTTVAQADSAIGGKTGVDSTLSKNAYGTFHHPSAVFVDVETLKTLDRRQYIAGLAESVKHGLIADAGYFEYIEKNTDAILARESQTLERLAEANSRIKASIVEQDPTEKNLRRALNYGHTIGHAAESASGYGLLHGEAVAVGMVAAAMIEVEMGLGTAARLERVRAALKKIGLPVAMPKGLGPEQLMGFMQRDKKAVGGWPRFVLLEDIGRVHSEGGQWAVKAPQKMIEKALGGLCG